MSDTCWLNNEIARDNGSVEDKDPPWRKAISASAAAAGALAGSAIEPMTGTMLGAIGGALAEHLVEDIFARVQKFIRRTEAESGLTVDELTTTLMDDDVKRGLFQHAVSFAVASLDDGKITLLAKVFVRALQSSDGTLVERANLLLGVVAQLEAPHITVLAVMASQDYPGGVTAWTQQRIGEANPGLSPVLRPLLRRLESLGLVEDSVTGFGSEETSHLSAWAFTAFGHDLVTFLRTMPLSPEPGV